MVATTTLARVDNERSQRGVEGLASGAYARWTRVYLGRQSHERRLETGFSYSLSKGWVR